MNHYVTHLYSPIPFRLSFPLYASPHPSILSPSLFPSSPSSRARIILCAAASIPSSFLPSISGGIPAEEGETIESYSFDGGQRIAVAQTPGRRVCRCKTPRDEGRGDERVDRFRCTTDTLSRCYSYLRAQVHRSARPSPQPLSLSLSSQALSTYQLRLLTANFLELAPNRTL